MNLQINDNEVNVKFPHHYHIWRDLPKDSGIYMLRNFRKKKSYIGFAYGENGIRGRVEEHIGWLRTGKHINKDLLSDWVEDDTCWVCTVLEITNDETREEYYTRRFNTYDPSNGYNKHIGKRISESTKQKMSNAQKGVPKSQDHIQHMMGHKVSDETKRKISETHKRKINKGKGADAQ
jgi:hypothetical protein